MTSSVTEAPAGRLRVGCILSRMPAPVAPCQWAASSNPSPSNMYMIP